MPPSEAEALALLAELLGAEELDPADPHRCPGCLTPTTPSPAGHRTYCHRCSVASIPGTFLDNALRIEFRLTWTQYWSRVERYGAPWQNRHAWVTPQAKLRQNRKGAS